jgi:hypothetical protein
VGDGEKLLTYLNSVLKVLSGLDIFPRGTKKSEILLTSVFNQWWFYNSNTIDFTFFAIMSVTSPFYGFCNKQMRIA